MMRRTLLALGASLVASGLAPVAHATPAEIVIVVDTSASMAEPSGGPGGETKLDVAARIAGQVAAAAAAARHRVGLVRFRQLEEVVMSGQGPRTVHVEDEDQCRRWADLLVPVAAQGAAEVERWTDRTETPDNPELVALGDSPLYGAVRLAVGYLRARRQADPATSCVNAFVVILTDGQDTCAAGAERENVLGELRALGTEEDIRTLVLAFDPEAESATLLSRVGHEADAEARPFAPDEAGALVARVRAIEGRLAPEACVVSGVAPELVGVQPGSGAPPPAPPPPAVDPSDTDGGGGCSATPGPAGGWCELALLVGLVATGLGRRRRRLALAFVAAAVAIASACGDDGAGALPDAEAGLDVGTPDGGGPDVVALADPSASAEAELARLAGAVDIARRVRREHLAPLLEPEQVFERLAGDPVEACAALTRSLGYEPYVGTQQGVRGCLATRRCNTLDAARVLAACLDHHGIAGTIHRCRPSAALRPRLAAASARAASQPDLAPAEAALHDGVASLLAGTPGLAELLDAIAPDATAVADHDVRSAVDGDVERLLPIVGGGSSPLVTASGSATTAASRADIGHRTHHYVALADGTPLDPVLADSPLPAECDSDAVTVLAEWKVGLRLRVLVSYADVSPTTLTFGTPVVVGEIAWNADERWGEPASVALVDSAVRTLPDGIPAPASSSCMRALLAVGDRTEAGAPFFLQAEQAEDCGGAPAVEATPGRQLASITLRTEVTVAGDTSTLDRVLVDRYGYALREDGAHASGPMFSNETARSLMAMRVDLLAAAGLPGPHKRLDLLLEDLISREDDLARRLRAELAEPGAPVDPADAVQARPPPYAWATVSAFTRHAEAYLPEGAYLLAERPWRVGVVQRRAFVPGAGGLAIAPVAILDIHELPETVVAPGARGDAAREAARLEANLALGALATEAERFAMSSYERTRHLVHAGLLLRDPATGPWARYGSASHPSSLFPISVRTAHRNRMLNGETMITMAGPVELGGSEYIAWWRVNDETGSALGEIRYEGSFYGGAVIAPPLATTVVGAIGKLNACLWGAAILAFQDGRSVPDVACCQALALDDLAYEMMLDFGGELLARLTDDGPGGRPDAPTGFMSLMSLARLARRLNELRARLEALDDVTRFYDRFGMESACLSDG